MFIGEGWSLPFATTAKKGPIYTLRMRIVSLNNQMLKIPVENAKAAAKMSEKAKTAAALVLKEAPPDGEKYHRFGRKPYAGSKDRQRSMECCRFNKASTENID